MSRGIRALRDWYFIAEVKGLMDYRYTIAFFYDECAQIRDFVVGNFQ